MKGDFCDLAKQFTPTPNDVVVVSDGLASDLLAHNTTGERQCKWKP